MPVIAVVGIAAFIVGGGTGFIAGEGVSGASRLLKWSIIGGGAYLVYQASK